MKDENRVQLRFWLAAFISIAARVPHEPDTMLNEVDRLEDWIDALGDNKVMRAVSPLIKPPTQAEIDAMNRDRLRREK
jgi:hypothetical protein